MKKKGGSTKRPSALRKPAVPEGVAAKLHEFAKSKKTKQEAKMKKETRKETSKERQKKEKKEKKEKAVGSKPEEATEEREIYEG